MKNKPRTVVIADDHPILLKGLEDFLTRAGFDIVAAVGDGRAALTAIRDHVPAMVVLDISLPLMDGLTVAKTALAENYPGVISLLSIYDDPAYIARAKQIPVQGYILKDTAMPEIAAALEVLLAGGVYFDDRVERGYRSEVLPLLERMSLLSPSEIKIVRMLATGMPLKEVAATCFISIRTAEKHRENIRYKIQPEVAGGAVFDRWVRDNAGLIGRG